MLSQTLNDEVLVTSDKTKEDEISYKSLIQLARDPDYDPTGNARCYAEVMLVPQRLSQRWNSDDLELFEPGARVYFDYRGLIEAFDRQISKDEFLIPWHHIYGVVRDGEVQMVSGWALAEYVYPKDTEEIEVDGHKVRVSVSESGLVTGTEIPPLANQARIISTGGVLPEYEGARGEVEYEQDGRDLGLKEGDVIYHMPAADFRYEVEGKDLLIINHAMILGKIL